MGRLRWSGSAVLVPVVAVSVLAGTSAAAGSLEAGHRSGARGGVDTVASRCAVPERAQFDFWLGRWTVRDSTGKEVGRSEITRVADGCAILERWEGAEGVHGTSLNVYDGDSGRWRQLWAGGGGLVLRLAGGLDGEAMVLSGSHVTSGGATLLDRIRWAPMEGGGVRQTWEVSKDDGETWRLGFDGRYVPR